ncbi:hypothetical protein BH11BAC5_BH11BAC5_55230 [soil metagenome]
MHNSPTKLYGSNSQSRSFGRLYSLLTRPNGFSRAGLTFFVIFFCVQDKKVKKKQRLTKRDSNLNSQSSQIRKYKPVIKYLRDLRQQEYGFYIYFGFTNAKSRITKAETTLHNSSTKLYGSNSQSRSFREAVFVAALTFFCYLFLCSRQKK